VQAAGATQRDHP